MENKKLWDQMEQSYDLNATREYFVRETVQHAKQRYKSLKGQLDSCMMVLKITDKDVFTKVYLEA